MICSLPKKRRYLRIIIPPHDILYPRTNPEDILLCAQQHDLFPLGKYMIGSRHGMNGRVVNRQNVQVIFMAYVQLPDAFAYPFGRHLDNYHYSVSHSTEEVYTLMFCNYFYFVPPHPPLNFH